MPFVLAIIGMLLLLLPGSIPVYFVVTFLFGIFGKELSLNEKVKKFSGFNLGKRLREKYFWR